MEETVRNPVKTGGNDSPVQENFESSSPESSLEPITRQDDNELFKGSTENGNGDNLEEFGNIDLVDGEKPVDSVNNPLPDLEIDFSPEIKAGDDPVDEKRDPENRPRLHTALPGPLPEERETSPRSEPDAGPQLAIEVLPEPGGIRGKEGPPIVETEGHQRPESEELSAAAQARMKDMQEVAGFLNENFDILDSNTDGNVTEEELAAKIVDPEMGNGDNAAHLLTLHHTIEGWSELTSDGDKSGLSRADTKEMLDLAGDENLFKGSDRAAAIAGLHDIFPQLNSDNNAYNLTPAEVDLALEREDLNPVQKQALKDLRDYQEHMLTKEYPGSFKDDQGNEIIPVVEGNYLMQTPRENMGNMGTHQLDDFMTESEHLAMNTSEVLQQAKARIEQAEQNPGLISQGTDGSCFFMAPLSAMQHLDPQTMDNMIADNEDGTFTVTFPGDAENPITVNEPTKAEMAGWANSKQAAIMEKAFAEHYINNLSPEKREHPALQEKFESPVPSARIQGGYTPDAMKLLTGKEVDTFEMGEAKGEEALIDFLRSASEDGVPISADTHGQSGPELARYHSYGVRFDGETNEVILENPVKPPAEGLNDFTFPYEPFNADRKAKDGTDDGIFRLSTAEFMQRFDRIHRAR